PMAALRRFETSPKRLKCAKSGHTRTAWRTRQIDPLLPFTIHPLKERKARESGLQSAGVGCTIPDYFSPAGERRLERSWFPPQRADASIGRPAAFHSGKPSSSLRAV